MKAPWPKFSTSISPNTKVRPDAMIKIIMPIASPAAVRVTHALPLPTIGSAASASSTGSATGRYFWSDAFIAPSPDGSGTSLVGCQAEAEEALMQRRVVGERGHRAGMDDAAVVHHRDRVAERARDAEILLDQQ